MATINAISVALFNAAAGGYAAEMEKNGAAFANAVGPVLEKDISTDALFVEHLLGNLGVTSTSAVYAQAKAAVAGLVTAKGRLGATVDAVDFLKAQEGSTSAYASIAADFAAKVNKAALFTAANPTERDVTKLISGVTGVDTDAAAIAAAAAAATAAAEAKAAAAATAAATAAAAAAATAAAEAKAAAEKVAADAAAAAKTAADAAAATAAAEAKAAAEKVAADAAAAAKTAADAAAATAAAEAKAAAEKVAADAAAAAKAAADAALAAVDNTTYASEQAALDAANAAAATAAAAAKAEADAAAAKAAADLAAANATITSLQNPAGSTFVLTTSTEEKFGTAGNDTFTATSSTFGSNDIVVDGTATDNDTLNITATADITATTLVVGVENINITTAQTLSSGDTTLSVAVTNIRGGTVTFDVDNSDTLIDTLAITSARSGPTYVANSDFSTVSASIIADADVTLNVKGTSVSLSTTAVSGTPDDLTVIATNNLTISASASTEDLVVTAGGDATITANSILGNVTVTAGDDVSVTATAALGNVVVTTTGASNADVTLADVSAAEGDISVTTKGEITVTTATAAEGTLTLNNSGAEAGDGITITDANSVTAAVITSVGAITATANSGLAAVETLTATAARSSSITVGGVDEQVINLNAVNEDGDSITFTLVGDTTTVMTELNLGGTTPIVVAIEGDEITGATVTSSNTSGASLYLGDENANLRYVDSDVTVVLAGDFDNKTLTVDGDTSVSLDTEVAQTAGTAAVIFDHITDATTTTSTSLTLGIADSVTTNTDNTANVAGLTFTDIQALTIAMGSEGLTSTADITGADLRTVTVTGSGAFNLGTNTITGNSVATFANVSLNASAVTGVVTVQLDGTANGMESVTTGAGADVITVGAAAASGDAFSITTNAGADTITLGAAVDATINGGSGTDKVILANSVNIASNDVTLTSIEQLQIGTSNSHSATVAASWISGVTMVIDDAGTATNFVISMDQLTLDLSNLAFTTDFVTGSDYITINASGLGVASTVTGSSVDDVITGTASADTIIGGGGADTIDGGSGADTLTGGSGIDTFSLAGGDVVTDFVAGSSGDKIDVSAAGNSAYSHGTSTLSAVVSEGSTAAVTWADGALLRVTVATRATLDTQTEIATLFGAGAEFEAPTSGDEATLLIFAVDTGKVYVYSVDEGNDTDVADAGEVTLMGTLNSFTSTTFSDLTASDNFAG